MIRGSGAPGGQVQGKDWEQQYTHDTIITHMILLIPNSFQMFVVDISLRHQNLQMCFFLVQSVCVCVCASLLQKNTCFCFNLGKKSMWPGGNGKETSC